MEFMKINKRLSLGILLILIFIISAPCLAKEFSIKEAIFIGLESSKAIKDAEENFNKLQGDIARILAQEGWQVNLGADYSYTFDTDETRQEPGNSDSNRLDITAGKTYKSGLTLNSRASLLEENINSNITITLSKPIFPALPSEFSRTYYKMEKDLLKAERNLEEQKTASVLSWLESYLSLNRMSDKNGVYTQSVVKAEANMSNVLQRIEIGDAGENQLLTARLSLENAKYLLQESDNQIKNARYSLVNTLGLSDNEQIIITNSSHQIHEMMESVNDIIGEYLKNIDSKFIESSNSTIDYLMSIVAENNYDLQNNLLDREILEHELKWLVEEGKADIDLNGSYNSSNDEITIGLNLSYSLYDGGIYNMDIAEKELELENNKIADDELYKQLKQELKVLIDKFELSSMAYSKEKLNLEKSELELDVAEKQLTAGLIDYLEFQDYWISAEEAEINLQSLEDQLFIDRLEFVKLIATGNVAKIIGGF